MSQQMVTHRHNNQWWITVGAALAVLGAASVVIALIVGNTWNEEGGTLHGVVQTALLVGGAFAFGLGLVAVIIGLIKRKPVHPE